MAQNQKLVKPNSPVAAIRLIRSENVGPVTYHQLIQRFGSAEQALDALPELAAKGGRKKPIAIASESDVMQEIATAQKLGANILQHGTVDYPDLLQHTADAPPILYAKGQLALLSKPSIGMVGARNASANGQKFAQHLARELGQADYVVTSGLARGIDTAAHTGALATGTIGVIASGIDLVYPKENQKLYDQLFENGLVLSEFAPGIEPIARHFPARNRIISGLSKGVVVVEAAIKSGSLITAKFALEQGREVFAVPGSPLDPRCKGTNGLIKDGAIMVESARDILDNLPSHTAMNETQTPFEAANDQGTITDDARKTVQDLLSTTPIEMNELIRLSHLPTAVVLTILLELELAGRLNRHPGSQVSLSFEL